MNKENLQQKKLEEPEFELPNGNRLFKWIFFVFLVFPWLMFANYYISSNIAPRFADVLKGFLRDLETKSVKARPYVKRNAATKTPNDNGSIGQQAQAGDQPNPQTKDEDDFEGYYSIYS